MNRLAPNISNYINIAGQEWSDRRVFIIAEAGTAHQTSLKKAKELVEVAGESGADCIKFQHVYADEILHPNTGTVPLPGGNISLYQGFKELERDISFFAQIKDYCTSLGIVFLCSPFGPKSARELISLSPAAIKIASPELNYPQLITQCVNSGLPLILSTGVSRLGDIEAAVELAQATSANKSPASLAILHCITSYPAPEREYNLRVLQSLSACFGLVCGVSDHSLDPRLVPMLAVSQGAAIIEKHICISRNDPGLDDPIALEPKDFSKMTRSIRQASQQGSEQTIAQLCAEKGEDLVKAILGNGIKKLAPSEIDNYARTRRSVHALTFLPKGHVLKLSDMAILRTEKQLRPGLSPEFFEALKGHTLGQDIPAGEGIRFEDLQ